MSSLLSLQATLHFAVLWCRIACYERLRAILSSTGACYRLVFSMLSLISLQEALRFAVLSCRISCRSRLVCMFLICCHSLRMANLSDLPLTPGQTSMLFAMTLYGILPELEWLPPRAPRVSRVPEVAEAPRAPRVSEVAEASRRPSRCVVIARDCDGNATRYRFVS